MKGKRLITTALAACIALGLLLSGCTAKGSASSDGTKAGNSIEISITIEYPKKAKLAGLENIKFTVEENATALQAIELFCSVSDIPCLLETTSNTIVGINTVRNGDFGENKVWKFAIGEDDPRTDASAVHLKKGDVLKWTYVTEEQAGAGGSAAGADEDAAAVDDSDAAAKSAEDQK